jgi:hypothetical protein
MGPFNMLSSGIFLYLFDKQEDGKKMVRIVKTEWTAIAIIKPLIYRPVL